MLTDDEAAEFRSLRSRVYGRGATPSDAELSRLAELAGREASPPQEHSPPDPADERPTSSLVAPVEVTSSSRVRFGGRRRSIGVGIAAIAVVAAGAFSAGLAASPSPTVPDEPSIPATTPQAPELPADLVDDYARIAEIWQWDPGSLRLGDRAEGAVIWAGSLRDATEVCLVIDEPGIAATMMCNPAGVYPSEFEWQRTSQPAGTYVLVLQQTGDVAVSIYP